MSMKSGLVWGFLALGILMEGCTGGTSETAVQPPASLDPFLAEEMLQKDRPNPRRAKTQELFARASDLPSGPQDVVFYSRREESLSLFSEWSGVARTDLAEKNGLKDSSKELPVNTPLTIPLTADQLDRLEHARDRYHETYQNAFFKKFTVQELQSYTIQRGDSLWKLSRLSETRVPLWLMAKLNPGSDLSVLNVGDTVKIPILVASTTGNTSRFAMDALSATTPLEGISDSVRKVWAKPAPVWNPEATPASRTPAPQIAKRSAPEIEAQPAVNEPVSASNELEKNPLEAPATVVTLPVIPVAPAPVLPEPVAHSVVVEVLSGESLSHYAAWSGVSVKAIMAANGLADPNRLRLGQKIKLPVPDQEVESFYTHRKGFLEKKGVEPTQIAGHAAPPWTTHRVAAGESAWVIAVQRHRISLQALSEANPNINLERLQPGMVLRIPSPSN